MRFAPLLLLALAAAAPADTASYLKARAARGILQASGPAAMRGVREPRVLELSGKPDGTCQVGDVTVLVLKLAEGGTQEVQTKTMPAWLADTETPVRLLVRCEREGTGIRATLLDAAPEIEVLKAEEAYWRAQEAKRRLTDRQAVAARTRRPVASRHGDIARGRTLYGPIGRSATRAPAYGAVARVVPFYAAFIRGQNPRLSPDKATEIAHDLLRFSVAYGVEPRLVVAILMVESGFDPNSVSRSGAVGLGQLMPDTARWMGVHDSYDTTQNLYGMIKLLNTHSRQFNRAPDDPLVLAAYNAGEGAVRRHGGVPPFRETQAYVKRVTAYYQALRGY